MSGFTSMSLCRETCIKCCVAVWIGSYLANSKIFSASRSQRYSSRSVVYVIRYPSDFRCIRVLNSAFVGCSRCALGFQFPEKYAHQKDPLNQGNLHELKLRLKIIRYPGIEVVNGRTGVRHFGWTGSEKINFRMKILPKIYFTRFYAWHFRKEN